MEDLVKYMSLAGAIVPMVRNAVELTEELFSDKPGEEKKDFALKIVGDIVNGAKENPYIKIKELDVLPIEAILVLAGQVIDIVVAIFNLSIWKKV